MDKPSKISNLNRPELKGGDRVVLLSMQGETIKMNPPTAGTVKKENGVAVVFGIPQYKVDWDDEEFNRRGLQILSDVDDFVKEEDFYRIFPNRKKKIDESIDADFARRNKNLVQDFKMAKMYKFYEALRKSSVVNMFGSAPYFWMGKDRIAHEHFYTDMIDDQAEAFEEVLDSADEIKNILISGSLKTLEREGKEVTLDAVKRVAERKARQIVSFIQQVY
jgi:hypothetical protein